MKTRVKLSAIGCLLLLALCLFWAACEQTPAQSGEQSSEQASTQSGEQSSEQAKTPMGEIAFDLNEAGDGYVITGIGTFTGTELVIPQTHKDLPVVEITEKAFKDCVQLTSVTFPAAIEEEMLVSNYAFAGCTGLTQVTIPANSYGWTYAFEGCTGLETATLNCNYFSSDLFNNCTNLKHLKFGPNIVINLDSIGIIKWEIDKPDNPSIIPDGAYSIDFEQQYNENGEALYDENGEPIRVYYAWRWLPIESVTGGIIREFSGLTRYPNLNSNNVTDYTLNEDCQMVDGVMFGPTDQDYIGAFWIDPLVESLDFVKLSGIGEIDRYILPSCVNLKSITIDDSSTTIEVLRDIPKSSLTDIHFTGSIFDWVDKVGGYYGDSCTIHCTDGDISKELCAALSCADSAVSGYIELLYGFEYVRSNVESIEAYKTAYEAVLAEKTVEEYESYAEYGNAEEGSEEYALFQEYLAYRSARSRFQTTINRSLNQLVSMYMYHKQIVQSGVDVEAEINNFKNVHLPVLESAFGCSVEYEQAKENDLTAITNMNQLPNNLRSLVRIFADLSDPNCPQTPEEAKALYDQAVAAMIVPGYITQEELNKRISPIE